MKAQIENILCINYSQTGQLDRILHNFCQPLADVNIHKISIKPKTTFPFPWSPDSFYDKMPETVLEIPIPLEEFELAASYDLIIIGIQPWFLSLSLPVLSLFENAAFKEKLQNTPIISIIGSRNMWINAYVKFTELIKLNQGKIVANLVLQDRSPNLPSAVSIAHWMMTGKKEKKWNVFPLPGISESDIKGAADFGKILDQTIQQGNLNTLHETWMNMGSISINPSILFIEERAKKIFKIWANLIRSKSANRKMWVKLFRIYLNVALFLISPIILTIFILLIKPLSQKNLKKKIKNYSYLGIENA